MKVQTRPKARRRSVASPFRAIRQSASTLEHDLDLARQVQESLFPSEIPALAGLRVAALNRAARIVSGDFYDIIGVDDDRMVVVCADVSGKGIAAALLAAQVQSYFRAMLQAAAVVRSVLETSSVSSDVFRALGSLPLLVVSQLNATVCRHTRLPGRYATLFFAEVDARSGVVRYVNAGHNPPLVLRPGVPVELLSAGGPPVGLLADAAYEAGTAILPPGGTLLVYTDGAIEARDGRDEEFGLPRLIELCTSANGDVSQLLPRILDAVETWSASPEPSDDITLVAMGRDG